MSILIFDKYWKIFELDFSEAGILEKAAFENLLNDMARMQLLPMRNQATQLNSKEFQKDIKENTSWHEAYKNSPHIYVGGIPFELNEGDILTVFAQYGKIKKINLVREKETQKSKGFAFLSYENPKSAVLAVDNFDGIKVLYLFDQFFNHYDS